MFLDLSGVEIDNGRRNTENGVGENPQTIDIDTPDLTKLMPIKCAVVKSAKQARLTHDYDDQSILTDYHFDFKIAHRIHLEDQFRIVHLQTLSHPAYVVENVPFDDSNDNDFAL